MRLLPIDSMLEEVFMTISRSSALILISILGLGITGLRADQAAQAPTPVAKIGNTVLTKDDLRKDTGMSYYEAENALYQLKKNWVDQKVKTTLFAQAAKDAGLSLQAWQTREIDSKVTPPTQQDIDQLAPKFAAQGSTTPPTDAQYAKMKEQAKQYLTMQKR